MSTELLAYCLDKLRDRPRALNITQPIDRSAQNYLIKAWSKTRFKTQQLSILQLPPDHPDYGRGYLWPYEFIWTTYSPDNFLLRIEYNLHPPVAPRELILLASVSEIRIPFTDANGAPIARHVFRAAKSRMLSKEKKRTSGAITPSLRPAVANVQYLYQVEGTYIAAVDFQNMVNIEN